MKNVILHIELSVEKGEGWAGIQAKGRASI